MSFDKKSLFRLRRSVNWVEDRILRRPYQPGRRVVSSGCDVARNEIWVLALRGAPDAGTFHITVKGETFEVDYDSSAAAVQTLLEGHTDFVSGDVVCSNGPLPYEPIVIEFQGDFENTDMINGASDIPTLNPFGLTSSLGGGPSGDFTRWVGGFA